jgi:hypothetical protein
MPSPRKDGRRRMHDGRLNEVLSKINFLMLTEMEYDDVGVSAPSSGGTSLPTVTPTYVPTGTATSKEYREYEKKVKDAIDAELVLISTAYQGCYSNITKSATGYAVPLTPTYPAIHDLINLVETRVASGDLTPVDTTTQVDDLRGTFANRVADYSINNGLDYTKTTTHGDNTSLQFALVIEIENAFDKIKPTLITNLNGWVKRTQDYLSNLSTTTGSSRGSSKADIKKDYDNVTGYKPIRIIKTHVGYIKEDADLYIALYKLYDNNTPFYPDGRSGSTGKGTKKKRSAADGRKKKRKAADGRSKRRK